MIPMSDQEMHRIAAQVAQYAQYGGTPPTRQDLALLLAECARARWNEVHLIATVRRLSGVFTPAGLEEAIERHPASGAEPLPRLRGLPGGSTE